MVHGVLPRALVGRASEATPVAGAPTSAVPASSEGKGADLLADDFQGRLSMSVVGSMHEVSCCLQQARWFFFRTCHLDTFSTR